MATSLSHSPQLLPFSYMKSSHPSFSFPKIPSFLHQNRQFHLKTQSFPIFQTFNHLGHIQKREFQLKNQNFPIFQTFNHLGHIQRVKRACCCDSVLETIEKEESLLANEEKPLKFLFWVLLWASVSIGLFAVSGDAKAVTAAADSIRASGFGVKVATALRSLGWPDEAVVFALATLPVIELRGAIPVGYWLQLKPIALTVLSILGNMVPVPFIVLYLKKLAIFLAGTNKSASKLLDLLFERAKEKAGPVQEFQWLGLMLFVAVPFPGTGAWTGAIIASVLDMPFWSAVSANFVGVVLAGLLVNLLVNLGLKYAIITGVILFIISTFMWSILRSLKKSLS
ncbi:PREDICTED: uncharacterized protein LOC109211827 [Nicotiana attenuata]|uniref:Small multi-drug export protein n=1 Tax=Nicotiana attenuata TaxID=49451 RepID=A0A314KI85_NICAT|nr:PREDICTED: uncharacterized protein LOC109211827 [Nicotiana attenuata]OIT29076.1 hypothetical protein A4A49_26962 [Nicotiana attenuata]